MPLISEVVELETFDAKLLLKKDPSKDNPTIPPMVRKNCTVLPATPISLIGIEFKTINVNRGNVIPNPKPLTPKKLMTTKYSVSGPTVDTKKVPTPIRPNPTNPRSRYFLLKREDINWPERAAPNTIAIIIGVKKLPLLVAERPKTPWKNRGMNTGEANITNPVRNTAAIEQLTFLFRNRVNGINGDCDRISTRINERPKTKETIIKPRT
jgi:hypothetical protein